jgi:hypothetical protein
MEKSQRESNLVESCGKFDKLYSTVKDFTTETFPGFSKFTFVDLVRRKFSWVSSILSKLLAGDANFYSHQNFMQIKIKGLFEFSFVDCGTS